MSTQEGTPAIDIEDLMARAGIGEDLASRVIEAHGSSFTVGEALRQCGPFAVMLEASVVAVEESVPDADLRKGIIEKVVDNTIAKLAEQSGDTEVDADFLEVATKKKKKSRAVKA